MPPRYAYWTILIDNMSTAFRARERDELLPTLHQLRRKNADVVMKWFARGRLWESPEAERAAQRAPKPRLEKRDRDWRPGGAHKDPRARYKKKSGSRAAPSGPPRREGDRRPWSKKPSSGSAGRRAQPMGDQSRGQSRPHGFKPASPHGRKGWGDHPTGPVARYDDRPPERREEKPPPKPHELSTPEPPTAPERIATKSKPPERG